MRPCSRRLWISSSICGHDRRLDALGRLVEQQEFRAAHEHAGERELLLLAAAQGAGEAGAHLLEDGEEGIGLFQRRGVDLRLGAASKPMSRFS